MAGACLLSQRSSNPQRAQPPTHHGGHASLPPSSLHPALQGEGDEEAQGPSPGVRVLQQNSRLVLTTLQLVRDTGLPTDFPLFTPSSMDYAADTESIEAEDSLGLASGQQQQQHGEEEQQGAGSSASPSPSSTSVSEARDPILGVGYLPAFLTACAPGGGGGGGSCGWWPCGAKVQLRAVSLRLLVGLMGAATGIAYAAEDFVDTAVRSYRSVWGLGFR